MTDGEKMILKFEIGRAFTPSAPIDRSSLFAGRHTQVTKLINAVNQRGQHAVLFGERGVGKTSLANVLKDFLAQFGASFNVASTNCDAESTFGSIFKILLAELPVEYQEKGMGFAPPTHTTLSSMKDLAPPEPSPEDIRRLFHKANVQSILIIDEIDRIEKEATTVALADLIKTLSDHAVNVTLILVGVSDSVGGLIKEHQSIERALAQIPMPRMSLYELTEIVNKGLVKAQMSISPECAGRIAKLSHGLPHYTHSLGLYAAQAAVDRDSVEVTNDDVTNAIQASIDQAQQSIVTAYHAATNSPRENLYAEVLLACALAKTDDLGYFTAANVRDPMTMVMHKKYDIPAFSKHMNDFCEPSRGEVLQRVGESRRYKFRFNNPLMEPYVVMKGVSKKLIEPKMLDSL